MLNNKIIAFIVNLAYVDNLELRFLPPDNKNVRDDDLQWINPVLLCNETTKLFLIFFYCLFIGPWYVGFIEL